MSTNFDHMRALALETAKTSLHTTGTLKYNFPEQFSLSKKSRGIFLLSPYGAMELVAYSIAMSRSLIVLLVFVRRRYSLHSVELLQTQCLPQISELGHSQMLQSIGYQDTHIPTWVMKNVAKYLVDGSITQDEFVGIIKYLVDNHTIK